MKDVSLKGLIKYRFLMGLYSLIVLALLSGIILLFTGMDNFKKLFESANTRDIIILVVIAIPVIFIYLPRKK